MRHRLNKKDRVSVAGKGNNKAIYMRGQPKAKFVAERQKRKQS